MQFEEFKVNQDNFRSYDIRGEYPSEIDASSAYAIAQAFVKFNPAKRVVVGYDHRSSTPALKEAFIAGLRDAGVDVWDIGIVTTDTTYFASWFYAGEVEGAAMITASHMPAQFNGIKFITKELKPIGKGVGMEELYEFAKEVVDQGPVVVGQKGVVEKKDVMTDYLNWLWSFIDKDTIKPMHVVMDCGNGVAGDIVKQVFAPLGLQITELCFNADASFPNHEANPILPEAREHIISVVKETGADLGIAWDADADRAYFIDENGEFVHGDFMTALLAVQFLKKKPGASIVYDLRASNVVKDTVERLGGKAFMQKVGHAHIKKMMREEDAVFGGEVSGHYYFADNKYMDNGFIPPLMILELLSTSGKKLSELIADLGDYYVSGEINSKVEDREAVIEKIKSTYSDAKLSDLDGISVEYADWRFNVRPSANDPVIRLNLEANSEALMEQKRDEVLQLIRG